MNKWMENEVFITRIRWLIIIGAPVILWLYRHNLSTGLLVATIAFSLYNLFLQFYLLNKIEVSRYLVVFSVIDVFFLTYVYFLTLPGQNSIPQLYYFLILVMGIRHSLERYHWIVLINGFIYTWVTVSGSHFLGESVNPIPLFTQLLFFTAFGVVNSYIFKKDYQQQLEKEDLITELQAANQQLCVYNAQVQELANTDPLTGLYNYRYFTERLDMELDMAKRFNRFLSLIIIDVDHFKDFNDTYGHPAGDLALREAAAVFRQNIRDKDVLCRYGGEEFLILLPATGIEEAFKCAVRIRESVQHNSVNISAEQKVYITVSGGVACYPLDASNGEQLLRIADEVLYTAKHKGRNKIHRRL